MKVGQRTAEILIEGVWTHADYDNIKPGDIFRLKEPDGTPVPGEWVAMTYPEGEKGSVEARPYTGPSSVFQTYRVESNGTPAGTKLFDPQGNEVRRLKSIKWEIGVGTVGVLTLQINAGLVGNITAISPVCTCVGPARDAHDRDCPVRLANPRIDFGDVSKEESASPSVTGRAYAQQYLQDLGCPNGLLETAVEAFIKQTPAIGWPLPVLSSSDKTNAAGRLDCWSIRRALEAWWPHQVIPEALTDAPVGPRQP